MCCAHQPRCVGPAGELLDTPPPGLDEAVAIAKVVQFAQSEQYARFTRIVFDTAPTGHTLRLLALPDFVDASLKKIIRYELLAASTPGLASAFIQVALVGVSFSLGHHMCCLSRACVLGRPICCHPASLAYIESRGW